MAPCGQSAHDLLNARILLANPEEAKFHSVCNFFAYRALGNMLWRKVGLRTLNEVRRQHPVVSEPAIIARYSGSSNVQGGASPGS